MKTGSRRRLQQFGASRDAAGGAAGDYDATHYQAYHADTFSIDPWPFLGPFARRLQPGSRVLDIGCGSGRDLVWLRQQGFRVLGFERAPGLADLAGRLRCHRRRFHGL